MILTVSLGLSVTLAFLISNDSFYWISGKVTGVGILEYAKGLTREYPPYVGATAIYVLLGFVVDAVLRYLSSVRPSQVDSF